MEPADAVRTAGLHLTITFEALGAGVSDADLAAAALARGMKTQQPSWHTRLGARAPASCSGTRP